MLNEFDCFPGTTEVGAITSPPEMLQLATGERRVVLLHCLEDRLCAWRPDTLTDLSYNIVLIDGYPAWSDHCKRTLSALLQAAGNGCSDLHTVPFDGRDIRDDPLATELDLRQLLIDMIPIPVKAHAEGGRLMRNLLAEFLRGFSLRTLIFLLDMVLPQLDAYHTTSTR